MVDTPPGETYAEIAARHGRAETTVRNQWARMADWPKPLPEKRGRRVQFAPADVDAFVAAHIRRQSAELESRRLYTAREIEALTGITAATIRAERSKGRWPAPDDTSGRAYRWYGTTIKETLAPRRGYRRSVAPATPEQASEMNGDVVKEAEETRSVRRDLAAALEQGDVAEAVISESSDALPVIAEAVVQGTPVHMVEEDDEDR
ncbi:helix-turn-helix transcriptional regulator [Streptomyces sp. NPDC014748]|uniref:helix-turn-helix transcriptional regulator n=1 Tax=Streptomyces sp. NPDC014748 TaxID=3364905 RepID=UPI0037013CE5